MTQKEKIIKTYRDQEVTEVFDSERKSFKYQRYKHLIEANFLKKIIKQFDSSNLKILDVACGTGRMLPELFSIEGNKEYMGIDTSKKMIQHLELKAKQIKNVKNINTLVGDATKLPFKDNEFDVVYTYHLLWHLPQIEQEKIISEMLRVCKSDGTIIFDFLNKNFLLEKIKRIFKISPTDGIYKVSITHLKKILGTGKMEVEKLNDFPIKNNFIYSLANIVNIFRKLFPLNLFHMGFVAFKK